MITAVHHSDTRSIQSKSLVQNGAIAIDDWPVKDRIAHFERQAALHTAPTFTKHKLDYKPIHISVKEDEYVVSSFLESIGQKAAAPPQTFPQLLRLASEWNDKVQQRVNQRKWDTKFYLSSEKLSRVDSMLYSPDIARLEMQALDLLACTESSVKTECADEYFDDDPVPVEDETSFFSNASTELPALESGLVELSKEIQLFT